MVREEDVEQMRTRVDAAQPPRRRVSRTGARSPELQSEIDGVNTTVATMEAQLKQALYYLDNTTLTAPEDGRIINLQVRPGMVSGIFRIGGIAALIVEADSYLLATFYQENLKYVRAGQPVEVAFDLYPGQIFAGKVKDIWRANGAGQYLPSDEDSPNFDPLATDTPKASTP